MSKIDKKYIDNLQKFTDALEGIVELLKEQQKVDTEDVINEMLNNVPDKLQIIVDNQKDILNEQKNISSKTTDILNQLKNIKSIEPTSSDDISSDIIDKIKGIQDTDQIKILSDIESNTGKILHEVKEIKSSVKTNILTKISSDVKIIRKEIKNIKQEKETGMFSSIAGSDNRKKVTDAVKSIILIAGGVLAIGMAFKLVGHIDFASVVGLSLAILIMVEAFKKISDMNIGVTDMMFAGLMMILVSGSILAASFILNKIPTIPIEKGLTILFVGATLGVATWLILKSIKKINIKKNWATILLLPVILPLVATSILLSSYILSNVQQITLKQALSIALIGVAIGVASFAVGLALKCMKKATWKEILAIPIVIPLVAIGITLASNIFNGMNIFGIDVPGFKPIKDPIGLLLGSAIIGISILIFTPSLILIGKFLKGNIAALAIGALGIVAIAAAIVATAWIFELLPSGDLKYPSFKWGISVGLGMLAFVPSIIILGAIAITGIGAGILALGALAVVGIAATMLAISLIFNTAKFGNYPSAKWALGVGLSLLIFGTAMIIAAPAGLVSGIFKMFGSEDPLVKLAKSMLDVGEILSEGSKYWKDGNYPSPDWALGVGTSIYMFAGAFAAVSAIQGIASLFGKKLDFNAFIITVSTSMLTAAEKLSEGKWNVGYPTEEWSKGVGTALFMFAKAFAVISLIEGIGSLFGKKLDFKDFVENVAPSMVTAAEKLSEGKWNVGYPTEEWSKGVGTALFMFAKAFAAVSLIEGIGSLFGKKLDFKTFVTTASIAMTTASHLLQLGKWDTGYPTEEWALGVGGSLMMFAKAFESVSGTERGGLFNKDVDFSEFVIKASISMVLSSHLLQFGKWDTGYPTEKWAKGIGTSLVMFSDAFSTITETSRGGFFNKKVDFNKFIVDASNAMVIASELLSEGKWKEGYPTKEWSQGVGDALMIFSESFKTIADASKGGFLKKEIDFLDLITKASTTMVAASKLLSEGKWDAKYPSVTWAEEVGDTLIMFSKKIKKIKLSEKEMNRFNYLLTDVLPNLKTLSEFPNIDPFVENINKFNKVIENLPTDKHKAIKNLVSSIKDLSKALDKVNLDTIDKLGEISKGVMLVSIIDEEKLKNVLDVISDKKDELKEIYGEDEKDSVIKKFGDWSSGLFGGKKEEENKETVATIEKTEKDLDKEEFYKNIADMKGILQNVLDNLDSPPGSGSFNK